MDAKEFFSRLEKISKGELRFRNPINEYGKLQYPLIIYTPYKKEN